MVKQEVYCGIDRIDIISNFLSGKRLGLITNPTGLNRDFVPTIDILNEKFNLTCLFSPEHGVRGAAQAGDHIGDSIDEKTGVPVYSLFGATRHMTQKMLDSFDILLFDIQDIGARFYTYTSTLAYAMEDCAKAGKDIIVLDRPNPLGRKIEGTVLNEKFSSFVGLFPVATRHGLTVGEYAEMINSEFKIGAKLIVLPMKGYRPKKYFDEYDLAFVSPSPNMPDIDTALCYIGTCIIEGTNLSEGRGTTHPFTMIGAPWINSSDVIKKVNDKMLLRGVRLRECSFTPAFSKYGGECCNGIQIHILDRKELEPFKLGICLVDSIRELYSEFEFLPTNGEWHHPFIDLLLGTDCFREKDFNFNDFMSRSDFLVQGYKEIAQKYFLY